MAPTVFCDPMSSSLPAGTYLAYFTLSHTVSLFLLHDCISLLSLLELHTTILFSHNPIVP